MARRGLGVLVALLGVLLAVPALCENCPPNGTNPVSAFGSLWDTPFTLETATGGAASNGGNNVDVVKKIIGHWGTGMSPPGTIIEEKRIKDADGITLVTPDNIRSVIYNPTYILCSDSSPAGPGCDQHHWYALQPNADGAGTYNWKQHLTERNATPGTYTCLFRLPTGTQGVYTDVTLTRTWGLAATQTVTFLAKDQWLNPRDGLQIWSDTPTSQLLGTTANGSLTVQMAPGTYTFHAVMPTGCGAPVFNPMPATITTSGGAQTINVSCTCDQGPTNTQAGNLKVKVMDGDQTPPVALAGATVTITKGSTSIPGTSDANGLVSYGPIDAGTWSVRCSKSGKMTGDVSTTVAAGRTKSITVTMKAGSVPTATEDPSDSGAGDENFWTYLFVPKQATLDQWSSFWTTVADWGPMGFMKRFLAAWNGALNSNPDELLWSYSYPLLGGGSSVAITGTLDFREYRAPNIAAYPDGGRGSVFGSVIVQARTWCGWMVYVVFGLMVMRWVKPKLQV